MSDGNNSLDNGDNDNKGGNDDDHRDDDNWAINLPDTAAAANATNGNNDEGVPMKTLVTATIWRKTDAADAGIQKGGVLNGPTTKLIQYSSLTFEALALPRSGCS
jgi:hypothetical protein